MRAFLTSLRGRLLLVLLGLTLFPALVTGGLAYNNARQTIEDRVGAHLGSVAELKKEQLTTWLDATASDVRLLADNFLNEEHFTEILDPRVDLERRTAFAGFVTDNLLSVQNSRSGYKEILFVDAAGGIILSTDPSSVGTSLAWHPAVTSTLSSPTGEFIQDIHRSADDPQLEMVFGHVLHAVDLQTSAVLAEINGAVIIRVRMEETIYPLINDWPDQGNTGETLLVRADGEDTLYLNPLRLNDRPPLTLRLPTSSTQGKAAQLAALGQQGLLQATDYRGVPVLAAYRTIPGTSWGFVAKQDLAEAFAPVKLLAKELIFATALVLLEAAITAVLLARGLTRPLARLVEAARSVAAGNLETILTLHRQDEIGKLSNSFKAMIAAVRERDNHLNESYDLTLDALVAALDARDRETVGHSRRVVAYTLALASHMGLSQEELTVLRRGALLHDIGKIGVPDAILRKPGPLTDDEWIRMRRHPDLGERILRGIHFLNGPARIVKAHQERWDGSGYPLGLAGEAIPLGARIFAVADAFDAITSDRPYRAGRSYAVARREIEASVETQFDPAVAAVFLRIREVEWKRLRAMAPSRPAGTGPLQPGKSFPESSSATTGQALDPSDGNGRDPAESPEPGMAVLPSISDR